MKIEATLTLNVDNQAYAVDKMSPQIQKLVDMFDDWRQEEADAQSKLLMIRSALRDLQRELYTAVTTERDATVKAAAAYLPAQPPVALAEVPTANDGSDPTEQ